jgi:hypothetical protein
MFREDVLASGGLDDRRTSNGYLKDGEALMAAAVGADVAWFSTCGSSLSVKAAMMAVAGGKGSLPFARGQPQSIVAGLIFSGVQPRWITPRWDAMPHLFHRRPLRRLSRSSGWSGYGCGSISSRCDVGRRHDGRPYGVADRRSRPAKVTESSRLPKSERGFPQPPGSPLSATLAIGSVLRRMSPREV